MVTGRCSRPEMAWASGPRSQFHWKTIRKTITAIASAPRMAETHRARGENRARRGGAAVGSGARPRSR
jgi:hypothetical protein